MTQTNLDVSSDIAVLTIDNPPVNALGQEIRAVIANAVTRLNADAALRGLVIACAGKTFCAGADVREFGQPPREPHLPDVVSALANSAKPIACALFGTVLGGGLEVAMGAHNRVAAPGTKLGLPESKLGLMPGAQGTQLLPRLIGMERALDMIVTGNPIDAATALDLGLIDSIDQDDLITAAVTYLRARIDEPLVPVRTRSVPDFPAELFDNYLAKNARKLGRLNAPAAIVEALKGAATLPFAEAVRRERELFVALRDGPQSAALRHVFSAERATTKILELESVEPRTIESIGVVGAGTMGTGIAINFLLAGLPVTIVEQSAEAIARGAATIRSNIEGNVASGRTSEEAGNRALDLLSTSLDYADLGHADLIIEAAFETMEVKRAVFGRLSEVAKSGAILASNTSYLDIDAIAAAGGRPSDTLGLHFFSPANIMKLLEIVRGKETAPDVLVTAFALAKRIGKVPVLSGNAYGFIGNRMLAVRRREAESMIAGGASPYAVDRVAEAFGLPMGPFRMGDLAGLDLGWSAETSAGSTVRERLCEAGRKGQKTGKGFYDYDEKRRAQPSPEAEAIIAGFVRDSGVEARAYSDEEILARLLWPMIDEGARLLGEGIARSAGDIDVVWLNGYGWPAFTGGPMFHAAQTGWSHVAAALHELGQEPSAKLLEFAAANS